MSRTKTVSQLHRMIEKNFTVKSTHKRPQNQYGFDLSVFTYVRR